MRLPSVVLHPRSRRGLSSGAAVIHQLRQRAGSHLDLEQLDTKLFRAASSSLWVPPGGRGVFGGQVLGQALHAATRTVEGALGAPELRTFAPASLHSYFLLRGQPSRDIIYHVRHTSDLRSFASRDVDAVQEGKVIFKLQTQFARTRMPGAITHANLMPAGVPPPEECASMRDLLTKLLSRAPSAAVSKLIETQLVSPVEIRYASGAPDFLDPKPPILPPRQLLWIRLQQKLEPRGELRQKWIWRGEMGCVTYGENGERPGLLQK